MRYFLTIVLSALLAVNCSCSGNEEEQPAGQEAAISFSPEALSFGSKGGSEKITVMADATWSAVPDQTWVSLSADQVHSGKSLLTVTASINGSSEERTANIDFVNGSVTKTLVVSQEAGVAFVPENYTLVWQDEFNDPSVRTPDEDLWWYETAEPGWVNNELQTYIAGKKDDIVTADVSDGTLKIRAIKDGDRVYSARVNTKEAWTYGYFEASLKLPKGKGTWPAFWMMPETWSGWPEGGEIDIMEHVGCVPTEVSSSIHCKAYYHAINTQKTAAKKIATVMDEFHIYALEWTPEYIKTYVDGVELFHYNPDDYPKGRNADTWPFNKPFQLKLNLAWGGDWGGMYGVDEACLPATYEIDYVRVYQKNE